MDKWVKKERIERKLGDFLSCPVALTITDNVRVFLSARKTPSGFRVRLHRIFLDAPESVLRFVAEFVSEGSRPARDTLRSFVEGRRSEMQRNVQASQRGQRRRLITRGGHHDLGELLERLNAQSFHASLDCGITWGARRRPGRKTLRLGSYAPDRKLIRINPILDRGFVPSYVLEAVVFHEMLHHALGADRRGSRNHYHTEDFRVREREFPSSSRAAVWLERNLPKLRGGQRRASYR